MLATMKSLARPGAVRLCPLLAALSGTFATPATAAPPVPGYHSVLPSYLHALRQTPLVYRRLDRVPERGAGWRTYALTSQAWPPGASAHASDWVHRVALHVPRNARPGAAAILFINNGINRGTADSPAQPPSDFSGALMAEVSEASGMIAVSVSDVPNQYLALPDEPPMREDRLVAATWRRFMDDPALSNGSLPLHVPMAGAAVRAMDLAARELGDLGVETFVVVGASKRAWAGWLTTLGDTRVVAIVPYVIEMGIGRLVDDIAERYGGGWPIALQPYVTEGVPERTHTPEFSALMAISDPLTYLHTPLRDRLSVPKLVVNASGDDFFPPDTAQAYLGALPGPTSLFVAPNSDHYGIRDHVHATLVPFLRRISSAVALPQVETAVAQVDGRYRVSAVSSEVPAEVSLWVARNDRDRDFRFACGVRYERVPFRHSGARSEAVIDVPAAGWAAAFFAFTYPDGFVASSPVQVLPPDRFPVRPPADGDGRCRMAR